MRRREFLKAAEVSLVGTVLAGDIAGLSRIQDSALAPKLYHHHGGGFRNLDPNFHQGEVSFVEFLAFIGRRLGSAPPLELPATVEPAPDVLLRGQSKNSITWVGHSTLLVRIEGRTFLTDPVWSSRVGPLNLLGPPRWTKSPVRIDQLPPIDGVVISHDHYDHLDKDALAEIASRNPSMVAVAPLGLRDSLHDIGVHNAVELDWGEEFAIRGVSVHCEPAQHFSGRSLFDRNSTLWASFALIGKNSRLYFTGDSGYWTGFHDIGEKYGGFDVAAVPIGAYEPRSFMSPVHMNPEEAVQAFLDLKAQHFVPIHWGTYNLADEPFLEPPHRVRHEAERRDIPLENFWLMKHGETREW
ncbi:MAG TPA: MBL fold metallo-hydrolase [Bacteroidota bacterium]